MNTSLSWIKTYVPDLDVTAQEYTDAMTLTGTKVEGFTELDADLDKIVIGQIDKIEKHPDADKLIICQVNIGTESIQIVTGAPNVKEGDKLTLYGSSVLQAMEKEILRAGRFISLSIYFFRFSLLIFRLVGICSKCKVFSSLSDRRILYTC